MTIKELHEILNFFITNDFAHLRRKVDSLLISIIGGLLATLGGLLVVILKLFGRI